MWLFIVVYTLVITYTYIIQTDAKRARYERVSDSLHAAQFAALAPPSTRPALQTSSACIARETRKATQNAAAVALGCSGDVDVVNRKLAATQTARVARHKVARERTEHVRQRGQLAGERPGMGKRSAGARAHAMRGGGSRYGRSVYATLSLARTRRRCAHSGRPPRQYCVHTRLHSCQVCSTPRLHARLQAAPRGLRATITFSKHFRPCQQHILGLNMAAVAGSSICLGSRVAAACHGQCACERRATHRQSLS